jgi:hypothetical protein
VQARSPTSQVTFRPPTLPAEASASSPPPAHDRPNIPRTGSGGGVDSEGIPEEDRMRSPSGSITVGPFQGAFRPSGLRKIDEAVAAAQLIAPQLFIDDDDAGDGADSMPALPSLAAQNTDHHATHDMPAQAEPDQVTDDMIAAITPTADALAAANDFAEEPSYVFEAEFGSVPEEYLDDEADDRPVKGSSSLATIKGAATADAASDGVPRPGRAETSNPRIVASHGKDQAQVSGELRIRTDEWPEKETTARELITIKPRRITREIPAVVPSPELIAEAEAATAAAAAAAQPRSSAAMTSTAIPVSTAAEPRAAATAPPSTAVERPRPASRPSTSKPRAGTGTSRAMSGPAVGWAPWIFGAIGVALLSAAYVKCRRAPHAPAVIASLDARASAGTGPIDVSRPDAAVPVATTAVGAAAPQLPPDAAQPAPPDARENPDAREKPDAEPRDAAPGYRQYREAAQAALDDNDYEAALELADKSLVLAKGARTYLIKADALRRLDRIDEALATVETAIAFKPDYAPSWEMKGRILWGARRLDEGRAAYEEYLRLRPDGATSDRIREILGK